jgi:indolepyruvate ferredoxin oxidoreductase beta subunit
MRWLNQLKPETGVFISDTQKIVPPFACRNRMRDQAAVYSKETPAEIISRVKTGYALDACGMAAELGNERAANTILLGILSTAFDFQESNWLKVISKFVPEKSIDINREAFLKGREWVKTATVPVADETYIRVPVSRPILRNELELVPGWCKGCDICVRMCPERCLELNEEQVITVPRPEKCTGCRICEWLCPDFAIKLHKIPAESNTGGKPTVAVS